MTQSNDEARIQATHLVKEAEAVGLAVHHVDDSFASRSPRLRLGDTFQPAVALALLLLGESRARSIPSASA